MINFLQYCSYLLIIDLVERRRRERINELTRSLAKLIPACQKESTTSGKVCSYVHMYVCL